MFGSGKGRSTQTPDTAPDGLKEEIKRVLREAAGETSFHLPPDHPISRYKSDHRIIMQTLAELRAAIAEGRGRGSIQAAAEEIVEMQRCVDLLHAAENHNVRQENTCSPCSSGTVSSSRRRSCGRSTLI